MLGDAKLTLMLFEAMTLMGIALICDEVFFRSDLASLDGQASILPFAAIVTTFFLAIQCLTGSYRPRAIAWWVHVPAVFASWTAALIIAFPTASLQADPSHHLIAFILSGPLLLLMQRSALTVFSRDAVHRKTASSKGVFTIVGGAAEVSTLSFPLADPRQAFVVSCVAERSHLDQMIASIRNSGAREIQLVSGSGDLKGLESILEELRKVPLSVKLIVDRGPLDAAHGPGAGLKAPHAIELQRPPLSCHQRFLKRFFDLSVTILLVLFLAPLLLILAALVALSSPGPVLFRQTRSGLNKRPFTIYKFRTMIVQENGDFVAQATRADRRVTTVGRLLRQTSLDELPQLLNVLKGDMSLIGPRPHALAHDQAFALQVADYELRHRVKPGLTGLAQVCGFRGETSTSHAIERRVALDLQYIDHWSVGNDMRILARTVSAVTSFQNAY